MSMSSALPKSTELTNRKLSKKNNDTVIVTTIDNHSSTSSSESGDYDESDLPTTADDPKPTSNTQDQHEFLTAHTVFGDYIRKHEIPRKVFHSSIGFITLYLYTIGVQQESFPVPFHVSFSVIFLIDLLRFKSTRFNYAYCQVLGFLMREKEVEGYNGVLWYLLGLDFSFSLGTKDTAVLSVLLLSWSDTAASTCGRKFGYLTPKLARNKSLAGSVAAFAIGVIASYLFYGYFVPHWSQFNRPGDIYWSPETSYLNIHTMSFLAGFVAALSEGIDLFNWDDNFTIPVLSTIFLYIVISIFHK